jgi:hypothetical protein
MSWQRRPLYLDAKLKVDSKPLTSRSKLVCQTLPLSVLGPRVDKGKPCLSNPSSLSPTGGICSPYLHSMQDLFSAINQATSGLEIHSPNMASQAHSSVVQTDSTAEQEQFPDEFLTNTPPHSEDRTRTSKLM